MATMEFRFGSSQVLSGPSINEIHTTSPPNCLFLVYRPPRASVTALATRSDSANAPAMQVAHRSHVINMLDGAALRAVIEAEKPHFIVPEKAKLISTTLLM